MPDPNRSDTTPKAGAALPPELVKKVADKVYAMLLADLRLEAERRGRSTAGRVPAGRGKGGR